MAILAAVKGEQVGWWDTDRQRFTPAEPGVAYQRKCAASVSAREARRWYAVVNRPGR